MLNLLGYKFGYKTNIFVIENRILRWPHEVVAKCGVIGEICGQRLRADHISFRRRSAELSIGAGDGF